MFDPVYITVLGVLGHGCAKCHCDRRASLCECHRDCHSFSFGLTWMNGQCGYHGSYNHDTH